MKFAVLTCAIDSLRTQPTADRGAEGLDPGDPPFAFFERPGVADEKRDDGFPMDALGQPRRRWRHTQPPVAKAAEILTERWTLLVLRELLFDSRRFNDLRKGVPLMLPATLLSKRLKFLEEAGVIERRRARSGKSWEYQATSAGEEPQELRRSLRSWLQLSPLAGVQSQNPKQKFA